MAEPARRAATYQDVLDAPPHLVAEVIGGVLRLQPRPAKPHTRAASRLGARLDGPFDLGEGGPGGWLILDEPELHLAADLLVPDLGGWRRAARVRAEPFDAIELDLSLHWADVRIG